MEAPATCGRLGAVGRAARARLGAVGHAARGRLIAVGHLGGYASFAPCCEAWHAQGRQGVSFANPPATPVLRKPVSDVSPCAELHAGARSICAERAAQCAVEHR